MVPVAITEFEGISILFLTFRSTPAITIASFVTSSILPEMLPVLAQAFAPVVGATSTMEIQVSDHQFLAGFAGFEPQNRV